VADYISIITFCFLVFLLSFDIGLLLYLYIRARREKTAKEVEQKKQAQGEVGLVIKHVYNPEIVEAFLTKFSEANSETAICSEFYDGQVRLWLKVEDVALKTKLKKELEKSGFHVG
jgi:hypothetical protein